MLVPKVRQTKKCPSGFVQTRSIGMEIPIAVSEDGAEYVVFFATWDVIVESTLLQKRCCWCVHSNMVFSLSIFIKYIGNAQIKYLSFIKG